MKNFTAQRFAAHRYVPQLEAPANDQDEDLLRSRVGYQARAMVDDLVDELGMLKTRFLLSLCLEDKEAKAHQYGKET